jgi:isoleucyl-tRNA synthetase
MKADLPRREPAMIQRWESMGIYERIKQVSQGREKFILHDGPPYANQHIHIGTAMNKILKDFIVKSKFMSGLNSHYIPGWDCHGLPIEHQVDLMLGGKKTHLSKVEFRQACREYAERFIQIQREEFKRLGVFGDWDTPYLTMTFPYVASIAREFGTFYLQGSVYRGKKPVYWCASCKTALAEAEVEYTEHHTDSIYVAFRITSDLSDRIPALRDRRTHVIIWTTTPWTIPANLAIALHPDFDYVAVDLQGEVYILAECLLNYVLSVFGWTDGKTLAEFKGKDLEGVLCQHPYLDRESRIIMGEFVTLDAGTGCVHIAPGHGKEDYDIGVKYGIPTYAPVDDDGCFTCDVKHFAGQFVFDANPDVVAKLKEAGSLLFDEKMIHDYPHCWRCKDPIIFRATEQWFISMGKNRFRERALQEIDRVQWIPSQGRDRIHEMIEHRPAWCLSRQRSWGVPIAVFYCEACGEVMANESTFKRIADLFETEGPDIWFAREADELLPDGSRCGQCRGTRFRKETDILDVWFDSGVSWAAILEPNSELAYPAHMYLEGSDQHRGWFHSALLTSVGTRDKAPYLSVLTHGFTVGGDGKKMSKSRGNVIAPGEIIDQYGAEVLRLWLSAADYRDDLRISQEILQRISEAYRRIRNTARFILGNLFDFNPTVCRVAYSELRDIDRFVLHRMQRMIERVLKAYEDYSFHTVFHTLHQFCVVDLSAIYLDILKDTLYVLNATDPARRSAQTVLFEILQVITRLMAPILAFTAEEIWEHLPTWEGKEESVHLSAFPEVRREWVNDDLADRWDQLIRVRGEVTKALELARNARVIGLALDARVVLDPPSNMLELLKSQQDWLEEAFIVSQVQIAPDDVSAEAFESSEIAGLRIKIEPARGSKCSRCWKWDESVGQAPEHPQACARCADVLEKQRA